MSYDDGIANGRIDSTQLGPGDGPCMTLWLNLSFDGTGQGFGGVALDGVPAQRASSAVRSPHALCGAWIAGILNVLKVSRWEEVTGSYCRVLRQDGALVALGHIVEDRWFASVVANVEPLNFESCQHAIDVVRMKSRQA